MGVGGAQNWKAETKYKANSLVYTNEKLYICMEDHTSGTDFATDLLSGKWKFIGNGVGSNVVTKDLINNKYTIASVGSTTDIAVEDISDYDYLIVSVSLGSIHLERTIKNKGETHESKDYDIEYTNVSDNSYFIIRFNISNKSTIKVKLLIRSNNWSSYPIFVNSIVGIKIQELTTDYIANLAMPSDVYETISVTPGVYKTYTPTANGYITLVGSAGGVGAYVTVFSNTVKQTAFSSAQLQQIRITCAVKKGTDYEIRTANLASLEAIFVYTVGDAKQLGLID